MLTTACLIRRFIANLEYDKPFSIRQLLAFGRRGAVDRFVGRLVHTSHLKRIARGLYVKWSGKILTLSDFEIAEAKAEAFRKEIVVHGLTAALERGFLSSEDAYDILLMRHKDIRKHELEFVFEPEIGSLIESDSELSKSEFESTLPEPEPGERRDVGSGEFGAIGEFGAVGGFGGTGDIGDTGELEGALRAEGFGGTGGFGGANDFGDCINTDVPFDSEGENLTQERSKQSVNQSETDEWTQARRSGKAYPNKLPSVFSMNGSSSSFMSINGRIYTRSLCQRYFLFRDTTIGKLFRALIKLGWDGCTPWVIQSALKLLTRPEKTQLKEAGQWLPAWLYGNLLAGLNVGVVLERTLASDSR